MEKKTRLELIIIAVIFTVLISTIIYAVYIEPKNITLEKIEFSFKNLPKSFDGYKIALLSDFHYGETTDPEIVKKAIEAANSIKPDIIFLAGDFISGSVDNIKPCMELLKGLKAKEAIFAVLGNHDYWFDADAITKALKDIGVIVLRNYHKRINIKKEYIYILGIDDLYAGSGSVEKSMVGMKYPKAFKILLSHIPDAAFETEGTGISLVVSGHTHGGQVKIPFYKSFIKGKFIFSDLIEGKYEVGDAVLYVSRGIGTIWRPIRFLSPPEVTEITLRKKKK